MQTLSDPQFNQLAQGAVVLRVKKGIPRVLLCSDGSILKIFHSSKRLGLAKRRAKRFIQAARYLQKRGVRSVELMASYLFPSMNQVIVRYKGLPGRDMASRYDENPEKTLVEQALAFLYELHQQGIYCRDFHPANLIMDETHQIGIIDIQNAQFYFRPVSLKRCLKNLATLFYRQDSQKRFNDTEALQYVRSYLANYPLSARKHDQLLGYFQKLVTARKKKLQWHDITNK